MTQPFKCPSCGAPLDLSTSGPTVRCHFCGNSVIVPEELRARGAHAEQHAPAFQNILGHADKLREMAELVRSGNKIAAIKLYRELFGVGLREAKDAVERLAAGKSVEVMHASAGAYQNVKLDPSQFPAAQSKSQYQPEQTASSANPLVLVGVFVVVIGIAALFFLILFISYIGRSERTSTYTPSSSRSKPSSEPASSKPTSGFATVALTFGSEGIGAGQFKDARSIGVDGQGRIYVAEYMGGRVQVFDAQGKFITQWMVDAKMPLRGMAVDRKGTVYIVQRGTITRYERATGKVLGELRYSGGTNFDDVAMTQDGGLITAHTTAARDDIVRFNSSGEAVQTTRSAISSQTDRSELNMRVAADGMGNIYALGTFNNAVFKFTREGRFVTRIGGEGAEPGQFRAPSAIAVDGQGRVYVSDTKGIQVFDTNGRYIDVFKVEGGFPSGLVFNDRDELFVVARNRVVKLTINKKGS